MTIETSCTFETTGPSLPPPLHIGGVNGIDNTPEQALTHAQYLATYAQGHSIEWIYNRTHSLFIDLAETILLNYQGIPTLPSLLLKRNWERLYRENPEVTYLQVCHSQGATHVKIALQLTPRRIRRCIDILALAPASPISTHLCHQSINYASQRDFVYYGQLAADLLLNPFKIIQDLKNLREIALLSPHPDAPLFDHSFDSPTFAPFLQHHLENYLATSPPPKQ